MRSNVNALNRSRLADRLQIAAMYAPAFVLFGLFVFYPLISGVRISFTDWNGYSQSYSFIGWDNYRKLFADSNIRTAFVNTLIYGVGSAVIQNVWGLLYALLLNRKFAGRTLARAAIYLPVMISGLIMGYIWYFMLQYSGGALNDLMSALGLARVDWLADPNRAVGLILFITSLQYVGQAMVIYLAGLQTIPQTYYEAAEMDGVRVWSRFRHITLPLLAPAIITNATLKLIGGLQLFDLVMALTRGGPGFSTHSVSTMINYLYFASQNAGYSATLGIALFLTIMTITIAINRFLRKREVEH
ncbi:carbohydrate ABC transporter membrane protein 1 (CUT1 family) [Cohnella sp. SGD-V74]|uniref:carbohydrate ABC transporter permease n=1 Tax=unclassified Cohnella TaxID=2636738 RepID=UPI000D44A529|nr:MULTISPECIES: sugar ABC transporter permease [unclassified Cohnella]PRX62394.1 carbohydrate ABC transporter membrane protein 1 (CUT1 family) [Cohnella sp. SGD-V74]